MKKLLSLFVFLQLYFLVPAQSVAPSYVDRLHEKLEMAKNEDSIRILALDSLADYYGFIQADSCLYYAALLSELAEKINYPYGKFLGYRSTFFGLNCQGNYPKALEAALNMLKISEQIVKEKPWTLPTTHYFIGLVHREMNDYPNAIVQFQKSILLQEKMGEPMADIFYSYSQLGLVYSTLNHPDSAFQYAMKGFELGSQSTKFTKYFSLAYGALGNVYMAGKDFRMAEEKFRAGIKQAGLFDNLYFQTRNYNNLAGLFEKTNQKDSCIYFAGISLEISQEHNFADYKYEASSLLTRIYESENKTDSTLKYLKIGMAAKDSVYSQSKVLQYQQYAFNEIQRQQELSKAREKYQNQVRFYVLLATALILLLLSSIFYRNNRQKQKDKIKIQKAYDDLKSTQAQLDSIGKNGFSW